MTKEMTQKYLVLKIYLEGRNSPLVIRLKPQNRLKEEYYGDYKFTEEEVLWNCICNKEGDFLIIKDINNNKYIVRDSAVQYHVFLPLLDDSSVSALSAYHLKRKIQMKEG